MIQSYDMNFSYFKWLSYFVISYTAKGHNPCFPYAPSQRGRVGVGGLKVKIMPVRSISWAERMLTDSTDGMDCNLHFARIVHFYQYPRSNSTRYHKGSPRSNRR
jgi:hypothetical protein